MSKEPATNPGSAEPAPIVLTNGHVIDPAQGLDRVTNVVISDGKIEAVGDVELPTGQKFDLTGLYVTPGWIDSHVHAYGSVGFSDVDSIGICQGVTSVVDAGDAGIATLDEFVALLNGKTITDVYAGPHIHPIGIMGFDSYSGRGIRDVQVERWKQWAAKHPDFLRYLKVSAYSLPTSGPLYLAKGIAEELGLPLYQHIGEFTPEPDTPPMTEHVFRISEAGDIVTHIYHNNPGRIIDDDGKVLAIVRDAERRGVLFDMSFGGLNFSWKVAETCFKQDLIPHMLSSDLQQYNVVYPCRSLSNIMSIFLRLGMSRNDIIDRVTAKSAKALGLSHRAGTLQVGRKADITVFGIEEGEFEFDDCYKQTRKGNYRFAPRMVFKSGRQIDCDFVRGQAESNWFMQISEDAVPAIAERLTSTQREFLESLRKALNGVEWQAHTDEKANAGVLLDVQDVYTLHDVFHRVLKTYPISMRDALQAVFDCFLEHPFTVQIGLFLARLDRRLVLDRLKTVTTPVALMAS